jgi:hypothetical protein
MTVFIRDICTCLFVVLLINILLLIGNFKICNAKQCFVQYGVCAEYSLQTDLT